MQKVTSEQVLNFVKTGKRTIKDVASQFGVGTGTARKHVLALVAGGKAKKAGNRPQADGGLGRPADLYQA